MGVSCKACRHECLTGVDMAKMKIEVLAACAASYGLTLRDRLVGYLPRYAGLAVALRATRQFAQPQPAAAKVVRALCRHQRSAAPCPPSEATCSGAARGSGRAGDRPRSRAVHGHLQSHLRARKISTPRLRVLAAGGYRVHLPKPASGSRPLCCGRTFLSLPASSTKPGPSSTAWWPRSRPLPPAAYRSSASNRAALLTLRDELASLRKDKDGEGRRRPRADFRGIFGARGRRPEG